MDNTIVYDLLGIGKSQGKKASELVSALGLRSDRELRLQIARERQQGCVIASGDQGYYRPATQDELTAYVRRMRAMMKGINASMQTARAALSVFEGQQELNLYDDWCEWDD